jgi:hypothetical protein
VPSKVLEEFIAEWILEDIADKIDPKQFGSMTATSTTLCLLDMLHNWLLLVTKPFQAMHNSNQFLRICFLDFSKAIKFNILQ